LLILGAHPPAELASRQHLDDFSSFSKKPSSMRCCRRAKASGRLTPGVLQSVDGFMNIALENTIELMNSRETNKYGDVFIRGNNGKQLVYKSPIIDTN
jgi:hypothetical protein